MASRSAALLVLGLLGVSAAWADEVRLNNGGVVRGEVVAEDGDAVTVRTDSGKVRIRRDQVKEVVRSAASPPTTEVTAPSSTPAVRPEATTLTRAAHQAGDRVIHIIAEDVRLDGRMQRGGQVRDLGYRVQSETRRNFTVAEVDGGNVVAYDVDAQRTGVVNGAPLDMAGRYRVENRPGTAGSVGRSDGRPITRPETGLAVLLAGVPNLLGSLADLLPLGPFTPGRSIKLTAAEVRRAAALIKSNNLVGLELTYQGLRDEAGAAYAVFAVSLTTSEATEGEARLVGTGVGEFWVDPATCRPRRLTYRTTLAIQGRPPEGTEVQLDGQNQTTVSWSYPSSASR